MSFQFDPNAHVILEDGSLVERDVLNIVERIKHYDPNLAVQYLERPDSPSDPPYRIVEQCRDGIRRVLFSCWSLDERVFERILRADTQFYDVEANLEKHNAAIRMDEKRRYKDRMDENRDIVEHALNSPKGTYTIPVDKGILKLDDDPKSGPAKVIKPKDS